MTQCFKNYVKIEVTIPVKAKFLGPRWRALDDPINGFAKPQNLLYLASRDNQSEFYRDDYPTFYLCYACESKRGCIINRDEHNLFEFYPYKKRGKTTLQFKVPVMTKEEIAAFYSNPCNAQASLIGILNGEFVFIRHDLITEVKNGKNKIEFTIID